MTESARDAILGRVRQALRTPSPEPTWLREPREEGPFFPLPANDPNSLRDRFRQEFEAVKGHWLEADSFEAGKQQLADWLRREEARTVLAPDQAPLRKLLDDTAGVEWIAEAGAGPSQWESFDVGVTLAESLVAESGTIAVSSRLSGRAFSVLPPTHLVVATADQLVPDLATSMQRLRERYGDRLPSTATWITGPSRTADIEKILVLGAHGPRRLVLLFLPTGSFDGMFETI